MPPGSSPRRLELDDIADLRAYEREREAFRDWIIALKKLRRVSVGPVVTLVFENRDTVRFQVQEMARAERMLTDAQIGAELDAYNPLIPEPGHLSATVLIELTTDEQLRHWLPRLVGIERSLRLELDGGDVVAAEPEAAHAAQLTREEVTASVHYVWWSLDPAQVERFGSGPVHLAVDHPEYLHRTLLGAGTVKSLLEDLRDP